MKNPSKEPAQSKQQNLPKVEVFCDARDTTYWYRVNGRYLRLGSRDLRMHLKASHGLKDTEWLFFEGGGLRETDYPLWYAQNHSLIDYAGPLAGHRVGVFEMGGRKFLVTEEPLQLWDDLPKKITEPKLFLSFIQELLGDQDQWLFFSHWLSFALRSLRAGDFRPGQCCVFAGDSNCGKSFLQNLITKILGGRSANPFRYMMEQTQFNADLAWGEHWQIEDPASTTDIKTRRLFGSKLKECLVNLNLSIHQKGKDALPLPVFRRVTISVNKEPENLSVIPPLDDSIKDKIFLFLCDKVQNTFEPFIDAKTREPDRKRLMGAFDAEIPVIRAWLLNGLPKLSNSLKDVRFGIQSWQHPELLSELEDLSPERRLLALIDEALFKTGDDKDLNFEEAKSIEIERRLREGDLKFEADKILKYPGACGTYLGRLCKSHPERVTMRKIHGYSVWKITKPSNETDKNQLILGVAPFATDAGLVK